MLEEDFVGDVATMWRTFRVTDNAVNIYGSHVTLCEGYGWSINQLFIQSLLGALFFGLDVFYTIELLEGSFCLGMRGKAGRRIWS